MKIEEFKIGMVVYNKYAREEEIVCCVDSLKNSVETMPRYGSRKVSVWWSAEYFTESIERLENKYADIACDLCKELVLQNAVYDFMRLDLMNCYGNTICTNPVYCPKCGKLLSEVLEKK